MGRYSFQFDLGNYQLKGIFFLLSSIFLMKIASAQSMDNYLWKNRVLLLFAPDEQNEAFQQQLLLLTQQSAEVTDRDLVFYKIFANNGFQPNGKTLSSAEVLSLRKMYTIDIYGFICILVGKDGTEKLRKYKPIPLEELFGLIDRMPMRKSEMRILGY